MSDWKDVRGCWRTASLFIEFKREGYEPLFTIKDYKHKGYPSLKQAFLKSSDPTEFTFASEELGGWAHWLALRESPCVRKRLAGWREELTQKLRSEAFLIIQKEAVAGEGPSARIAAEWIAKATWRKQEQKPGRGRPSKEEVKGKLAEQARISKEELEDAIRIGLN